MRTQVQSGSCRRPHAFRETLLSRAVTSAELDDTRAVLATPLPKGEKIRWSPIHGGCVSWLPVEAGEGGLRRTKAALCRAGFCYLPATPHVYTLLSDTERSVAGRAAHPLPHHQGSKFKRKVATTAEGQQQWGAAYTGPVLAADARNKSTEWNKHYFED
ncbi:hypothetical protein GN956_G22600 [Arapaima gigas]